MLILKRFCQATKKSDMAEELESALFNPHVRENSRSMKHLPPPSWEEVS
jgi:hypothetical protein